MMKIEKRVNVTESVNEKKKDFSGKYVSPANLEIDNKYFRYIYISKIKTSIVVFKGTDFLNGQQRFIYHCLLLLTLAVFPFLFLQCLYGSYHFAFLF